MKLLQKPRRRRRPRASLGKGLVGVGLVLLINALVFAWTPTGGAQGASASSPAVCSAFDRWGEALYVQPFFPVLGIAIDGVVFEEQAVAVAINGLSTGALNEANEQLAIDIARDFFEDACEGVDRTEATPTPEPTAAPQPTATPEQEPTATPEPTAEPEPIAEPEPAAEPEPTAEPVQTTEPTKMGDSDEASPGALAKTGAGPMTSSLAFVGGGLILAGAVVLAVEGRREPLCRLA